MKCVGRAINNITHITVVLEGCASSYFRGWPQFTSMGLRSHVFDEGGVIAVP